jgi:SAM-dependent methyltransferase
VLAGESPQRISVLEPACGSANDYRYLEAYGIARLVDYTGFDLCEKNIANARALFPQVRFEAGNVFEMATPDESFELCLVHDLLEHLSVAGLERAVAELCRVTHHGLCANFFQMDEMPEHIVRPVGDYYLNTLSLAKTEALFGQHGFAVQPLHIGSYLRQRVDCHETHNANAYTFLTFRN